MSRKGENIYKRKDGRWEGRYIKEYYLDGKAHFGYLYGKSCAEVKAKLREVQAAEALSLSSQRKYTASYGTILKLWLTAAKIHVKESSYARYEYLITRQISPALGKYPVNKIGTPIIEQYIVHLLEQGRLDGTGGLAPKTVSNILTIIKSTMEYARDNGYAVSCNLKKLSVKKEAQEMRVLTVEEWKKLRTYLLQELDPVKFGVLLCLYTGIRIGELCALRWEHLNLEQGVLYIRQTLQRVKTQPTTPEAKPELPLQSPKASVPFGISPCPNWSPVSEGN